MQADANDAPIRRIIHSDPVSVRGALEDLFGARGPGAFSDAERDAAELVLAEVLNNIVEHAHIASRRHDRGDPAPDAARSYLHGGRWRQANAGRSSARREGCPGSPSTLSDLPEGGFGWHLICLLATDLAYRRVGDHNELSFRVIPGQ